MHEIGVSGMDCALVSMSGGQMGQLNRSVWEQKLQKKRAWLKAVT